MFNEFAWAKTDEEERSGKGEAMKTSVKKGIDSQTTQL